MGFGDLETHYNTRIFLCFYIIISIVMNAYAIKCFTQLLSAQKQTRKRKKLLKQMQSLEFVEELSGAQLVGKHQFTLAVLAHLGVLDREKDIVPWMKVSEHCKFLPAIDILTAVLYHALVLQKFSAFDKDNSGFLNKEVCSVCR